MIYLRQSTASQSVVIGPFVDSTDGVTAETALSIANTDVRLSKNGANIVSKNSGGGTHDENGWYTITLDATDTNTVGRLQLHVNKTGALAVWHEFQVLEEAVYDLLFAASATGQVTVADFASGIIDADALATPGKIALYAGAVWFDDTAGGTGTTVGTHGLPNNPVNDFDDAVTLAGSTGLNKIMAINSECLLTAGIGPIEVVGIGDSTFLPNSQVCSKPRLVNLSIFGAFGTGSTVDVQGGIISTSTVFGTNNAVHGALLTGNIGLRDSAWTAFDDCSHSASATFRIDFGTNSKVFLSKFAGSVTLRSMSAGCEAIIDGFCDITLDATCTGGTVTVLGGQVTDNTGGLVTIDQVTGVNLSQVDGSATRVAKLVDLLDTYERVTITGGATATSLVCGALSSSVDDIYIDRVGVIVSGSLAGRGFTVTDYVGSTKTLTVDGLPSAPSNGDRILLEA